MIYNDDTLLGWWGFLFAAIWVSCICFDMFYFAFFNIKTYHIVYLVYRERMSHYLIKLCEFYKCQHKYIFVSYQ